MTVGTSFDPSYSRQGSSTNASHPKVPINRNTLREKRDIDSHKSDPLEILDHIKIVNTFESPMSTIRGVLRESKENDLSYKKEELKKVEQRLKIIFFEFYQKLRLLKHFRYWKIELGLLSFPKIFFQFTLIFYTRWLSFWPANFWMNCTSYMNLSALAKILKKYEKVKFR